MKKPSRKSKNYNGTEKTNKDLTFLLDGFLRTFKREEIAQKNEVLKAWYDIIPPQYASQTKALFYKKGALNVEVKSGALYSFLRVQEKPRLLKQLQKQFPEVKDIVFRLA